MDGIGTSFASGIPRSDGVAERRSDRTSPRPYLRVAGFALLALLVWATHVTLPTSIASDFRDPSWRAALGYAFGLHLQAGTEYVFTYGPLGFLSTDAYVPDIYWIKLAWEACFGLALAVVVTRATLAIPSLFARCLCALFLLVQPVDGDAYAFLGIWSTAVCVLTAKTFRTTQALFGLALLATFPLIKFSYAIPATCCALAIASGGGKRMGWALAVAFPVFVAIAWVLTGQSLPHLPVYVSRSLEIASAYSESMSLPAPPRTRALAFALMSVCAVIAAASALLPERRVSRTALAGTFLVTLWVAFKAGFVRGFDHTPTFFGFALVASFLVDADTSLSPRRGPMLAAARLACAGLSLFGLAADTGGIPHGPTALISSAARRGYDSIRAMLRPVSLRETCEQSLANARRWKSLPRVRETVGGDSIDMISSRQGILFLNDLRWAPRPVFQSYATLTPELADLNARFFQSEGASKYVLLLLESLDHRLTTLDDASALQVVARDYEPVLTERGYLLLRRAPRAEPRVPARTEIRRELAFGERLDLGAPRTGCRLLQINIPYTTWGKVRTFLDQAPALFAEFELDSGETYRARIVPSMTPTGAIIDPMLRTYADWEDWSTGGAPARPIALTIRPPESPAMYGDHAEVTILRDDEIAPLPKTDLRANLAASLFETAPVEIRSARPPHRGIVGNVAMAPALVVHAPSEMRIEVGGGHHTLRTEFGFELDAAPEGPSDGAVFQVVLRRRDSSEVVLFRRSLVPDRQPIVWRPEPAEIHFRTDGPSSLLLRADPGPSGDARGDWTAWSSIALE